MITPTVILLVSVILTITVLLFRKNINKLLFHQHKNTSHHHIPLVEKKSHDENEVFHVTGNKVTFDEAQQVCKQNGARLASYDELVHAYLHGSDFCNLGWSENQTAYYITQKDTWDKLQYHENFEDKHQCGNIGLNGGKFPKNTKFAVNCYGKRPIQKDEFEFPELPKKPIIKQKKVKIYDDLVIVPYNRYKWSRDDIVDNSAKF